MRLNYINHQWSAATHYNVNQCYFVCGTIPYPWIPHFTVLASILILSEPVLIPGLGSYVRCLCGEYTHCIAETMKIQNIPTYSQITPVYCGVHPC